ncbi:MAG TPA: hypothetical protein PKA20_24985 [Burkholderiaceae bacterium]|nr:hypothetical protein [Burkholderiaceae bacterium]
MSLRINTVAQLLRLITPGLPSDQLTVTAMVKQVTDLDAFAPIIAWYDTGSGSERGLYVNTDGVSVVAAETDQSAVSTTIGTLLPAWQGVAIAGYDSGGVKLRGYRAADTPREIARPLMSVTQILLGTDFYAATDLLLAQVRVWEAKLSDGEIAAEFGSATPVRTAALLGYGSLAGADLAACIASFTVVDPTKLLYGGLLYDPGNPPVRSADDPSFSSAPLLSGSSTLRIAA